MLKFLVGLFVLSTVLALSAVGDPVSKPASFVDQLRAGKPQKIVFFGTSLTQYGVWTKQVTDALDRAFPKLVSTVNSGGSGQNSNWGVQNIQKKVVDEKPDVVFIEFTINDSVERFHMSVDQSKANTEKIIDTIKAARPDCQIILQITNPVAGHPEGDSSHRKDQPAYEQMYRDLGKADGLLVIDHSPSWQAVLAKGEDEYKKLVPDGVHPNKAGCEQIVTPEILKAIGLPESK
jgi:alpha-L-rhamnosidase/acyl-CoA thioesterase-1